MTGHEQTGRAVTVAVCGTVMLSPAIHVDQYAGLIASDVLRLIREADISVCDFETVLTSETLRARKASPIVASPAYASVLRAWGFTHANCVHNHSLDAGPDGFRDTVRFVRQTGVIPLAGGETLGQTPHPLVEIGGRRIALMSYTAIGELGATYDAYTVAVEEITRMRRVVDRIIVFYHDGCDLASIPLPSQQERYRHLIQAGADIVIANQAHIFHGYEIHGGGIVFPSSGNFVLHDLADARFGPVQAGAVIVLTLGESVSWEIVPIRIQCDFRVCRATPGSLAARCQEQASWYASLHMTKWNEISAMGAIASPILKTMWYSGLLRIYRRDGPWAMLRAVKHMCNRYYAGLLLGLLARRIGLTARSYRSVGWLTQGDRS